VNIATNKPVRIAGIIGIVLGALFVVVGGAAWVFTSSQLSAQNITVPGSANFLAGSRVNNPFSALAQADTIGMHAEAAITGMLEEAGLPTDDTTFAGLGAIQRAHEAGTAENDAATAARALSEQAANLQANLFTSVLAYGVSLFAVGVGVAVALFGWACTRLTRAAAATAPVAAPERARA